MAQIINTNMASLTAQRNLTMSQSANETALQRLSSGLRINSAKDDAAGLAISTRFESQVRGLNQAIRNANDGISLAQTAEGALQSMTDNLQRIRELAVQSANGTNSDDDRAALQQEVSALIEEIRRTSAETNFNGRTLFDGQFEGTFQVGANAGQTVNVDIAQLTVDKIGAAETAGVSAFGTGNALSNGDLSINGIAVGASQGSDDPSSTVNASASAIAKAASINRVSDQTGVVARVNENTAAGAAMTAAAVTGTVKLNGVSFQLATGGISASDDRNSIISALNAKTQQTGVVASSDGDAGGVILTAADGRNINVEFTSGNLTEAATGLIEGTSYGGYTLISKNGGPITISGGDGTGTGDIRNAGLASGVYGGREATLNTLERSSVMGEAQVATSRGTFTTGNMAVATATQVNATNNSFELSVNGSAFSLLTLDAAYTPQGLGGNDEEVTSVVGGRYTTGDMGIAGATTVNATNNSFEVSIDGANFATLTLSSTFDAGAGVGVYDNATQLAAFINDAVANSAIGGDFRDADGNALFTASAGSNGSLVFTNANEAEGSSIVARTGSGTIEIASGVTTTTGQALQALKNDRIDFIFDGNNSIADGDLEIALTTVPPTAPAVLGLTFAGGQTTSAQEFADVVNAAIAGSGLAGSIEASLAENGTRVILTSTAGSGVTGIAVDAGTTITSDRIGQTVRQLANGDSVITDVTAFVAGLAGGADTIGISVDGNAAADLRLDTAIVGYAGATPPANADELVSLINLNAAASLAGSGITATNVGGQVVISSNSGGTVALSQATADQLGGAAAAITSTDIADTNLAAANGTALTRDFPVNDSGQFVNANGDVSPLTIVTGQNDTFTVTVGGAADPLDNATYTITLAAGTLNNMDDLAAAITAGLAANTTPAGAAANVGALVSVAVTDSGLTFSTANTTDASTVSLGDGKFAISGGARSGGEVTEIVNTGTPGVQGQYDDVTQLAEFVNNAILNGANDAFRDADGNALVTAIGDLATGQLVFRTAGEGEGNAVVARTGAGNLEILNNNLQTTATDAGTFQRTQFDFVFDGTNELELVAATSDAMRIELDGAVPVAGADGDITVAAGTYTDAQSFASAVNAGIAANNDLAGRVEARVSNDGRSVVFQSLDNDVNGIDIGNATANSITASGLYGLIEKQANGDTVITDVAGFIDAAGAGGANQLVSISVDGNAFNDLNLSTAAANAMVADAQGAGVTVPPTNANQLASWIQYVADNSAAGAGITATAVGNQVVLSSINGGSVTLEAAAADALGGAPGAVTSTDLAAVTQSATAGTVTTGAFNVNGDGEFVSADLGGDFGVQVRPLTIEAGLNDTFNVRLDVNGAGAQNYAITLADGLQLNTMSDLRDAVAAGLNAAGIGSSVNVAVNNAGDALTFSTVATGDGNSVSVQDSRFAISGGALAGATAVIEPENPQPKALRAGDLVINGTTIRAAEASDDTASDGTALTSDIRASGISMAAAINASTAATGVTAVVNATSLNGGQGGQLDRADAGSAGTVFVNGVETGVITLTGDAAADRSLTISAINAVSGQTGVKAMDNGKSITLEAADGRNVSIAIDNKLAQNAAQGRDSSNFGNAVGLSASVNGIGEADLSDTSASYVRTYANTAETTYSTVKLTGAGNIDIRAGNNGADPLRELGLQVGSYGGGESGTFIKDIDISTFAGAQDAITSVDNALRTVSGQRAALGAIQNRFESTVSNLQITSENLTAANSRIRDADFAAETAELSRTQVLQQAGISILAQANQRPQQVLSLLG